jgi:hypothetical protein
LYVFSALRPAPAPAGTLRLATIPRAPLNAAVLIGLVTLGVAMVMRPPGTRWWAVGLLLIGLLLLAVFLPLLGFQLINGTLTVGLAVLLVLWWVALVKRSRRGSMPEPSPPEAYPAEALPPEALPPDEFAGESPPEELPPAADPNVAPPPEGESHA